MVAPNTPKVRSIFHEQTAKVQRYASIFPTVYNGLFCRSSTIWHITLDFLVYVEKLHEEERINHLQKSLKGEKLSEVLISIFIRVLRQQ
jgi:hypothetical protein